MKGSANKCSRLFGTLAAAARLGQEAAQARAQAAQSAARLEATRRKISDLDALLAALRGRQALEEVEKADPQGLALRRTDCKRLHLLRRRGWLYLPSDGTWLSPDGFVGCLETAVRYELHRNTPTRPRASGAHAVQ